MKALVTGSNGFIGSHLVELLLKKNYQIKCLVRKTSNLQWIKDLPVEFVYGDVTAPGSLKSAVRDVDFIFHLGGTVRAINWEGFYRVNAIGTKNLVEACAENAKRLKRFVFISSQAAVGPSPGDKMIDETDTPRPISLYGKSKREAEIIVWESRNIFPVTILRPPSVYGPRDDDILEIFKYVKRGIRPQIGNKQRKISIIYVDDLVRGIVLAAESKKAENQIFFLTDKPIFWNEFTETIARVMNKKTIRIKLPEAVLSLAAFIGEISSKITKKAAILNKDKAREMKQLYWLVDGSRAEEMLGFKPEIDLQEGIRRTYQWYKMMGWL